MGNTIYMDNSATTPLKREVLDAMLPYLTEEYGNASSIYATGRSAKKAVDQARETVAAAIGAKPAELYFTACGSEADNWAIKGVAYACQNRGKHIITSAIEHHAVLSAAERLANAGFDVEYLPVNRGGRVEKAEVEKRRFQKLF